VLDHALIFLTIDKTTPTLNCSKVSLCGGCDSKAKELQLGAMTLTTAGSALQGSRWFSWVPEQAKGACAAVSLVAT
jgi:hypothetical protein